MRKLHVTVAINNSKSPFRFLVGGGDLFSSLLESLSPVIAAVYGE